MRRRWKWVLGALVVVALGAVGGPYAYIHFIEGPPPAKLVLPEVPTTKATSTSTTLKAAAQITSGVDGTFHVGAGSQAGYRVTEVLVGQHTTAVGRTSKIWGSVTISGSTVTAGTFSVNMASVESDQSGRNASFDGRIMDVTRFPTATLKLTQPIALGTVPATGATITYKATGQLTMHGVSRRIVFTLSAERTPTGTDALADIHIVFADWDISNPSVGGFVTTASTGILEVLVHLTKEAGNPADTGTGSASSGGGVAPTQVTVPSTTVPHLSIPSS
jgi:polyisoprenoid-binding protein YceI